MASLYDRVAEMVSLDELGDDLEEPAQKDVRSFVESLVQDKGLSKKDAMRRAAKQFNISRREVYKQLLDDEAD